MGLAPVSHVLFNKFMTFNPKNPDWVNRDRFVLSYVLVLLSPVSIHIYRWHQAPKAYAIGCSAGPGHVLQRCVCDAFPRGW